ncbi:glutamine synthetase adenylyltransferase [Microbacterium sp. ZKA21]|uniref:hypothetical protein n=1 Tax=Microbacterium sp. ZKA21 TaxID=3381694 RepID=UPI003D25EE11
MTRPSNPARQCTAKAKSTGERCGNPVVPGATICRHHGGAAAQVQRRAGLRLMEVVDPAIATLVRVMVHSPNMSEQMRAADSLLDRAGIGRSGEAAPGMDELIVVIEERLTQMENPK